MHKPVTMVFALSVLLSSLRHAEACTVFSCRRGESVWMGSNEDWRYSTDVKVWFVAPAGGKYGRVCFGWNQAIVFRQAQGGMNDQGLALDWALCPRSDPPKFSFRKRIAGFGVPENLLAECATVEEAVAWLRKYNILFVRSHVMLADRSGKSAVVEWVDREFRVVWGEEGGQVMTNFWLSHPELGNFPCPRYDRVMEAIENGRIVSMEDMASVLKSVSTHERGRDGKESGTVYSYVTDLSNGDILVFDRRDFEQPFRMNLSSELKKGNRTYHLRSLFTSSLIMKKNDGSSKSAPQGGAVQSIASF